MRITPLEIRQHTFDKSFRGYDTESVDAFLLSLSQEWERISEELRFSKQQLEIAEKEIVRMKEIESSLFKMLKAAEDAQQNINAKAESEANLITEKAHHDAEEITNEAQKKADMIISESENKAKFLVEEAVNDLKNYERDFKAMERYKDYLVVELKSFANDALDKVTKFEERINIRTTEAKLNELDTKVAEKVAQHSLVNQIISEPSSIKGEPEIDFEPASDFDDENEELPKVHIVNTAEGETGLSQHNFSNSEIESSDATFNDSAYSLMKEMKSARGRPRKLSTNDGNLPTVSSVMEELSKEVPAAVPNGGGSFFDDL